MSAQSFLHIIQHPLKFRMYLLSKLPSAFFSGVRVKHLSNTGSQVTVPFKWFSQNPFRSTYFACLAMAAEMSSGLLAMLHTYGANPGVSMLVTGLQAEFMKKATGLTLFSCTDGTAIEAAIAQTKQTGEPVSIKVKANGINEAGELVAVFWITWSFKRK